MSMDGVMSMDASTTLSAPVEGAGGVEATPDLGGLDAISKPEVALAIWRRALAPDLTGWLDAQPADALPHERFVVARPELSSALETALGSLPPAPERDTLHADILALAERFSDIVGASWLRIRLEAIEGDACRRFHQDAVAARLLCTYRGPATQWGYAAPGETPEDIRVVERGEASVWKGSEWPGAAPHTLVHRSPPIAGTGLARLLLVIDPADPRDDGEWAEMKRLR